MRILEYVVYLIGLTALTYISMMYLIQIKESNGMYISIIILWFIYFGTYLLWRN